MRFLLSHCLKFGRDCRVEGMCRDRLWGCSWRRPAAGCATLAITVLWPTGLGGHQGLNVQAAMPCGTYSKSWSDRDAQGDLAWHDCSLCVGAEVAPSGDREAASILLGTLAAQMCLVLVTQQGRRRALRWLRTMRHQEPFLFTTASVSNGSPARTGALVAWQRNSTYLEDAINYRDDS